MHRCLLAASILALGLATVGAGERPRAASIESRDQRFETLFDGRSLRGWHNYGRRGQPVRGWRVADRALVRSGEGGDLVSDRDYADFELRLEWKIAAGGNSGIFYRAVESAQPIYRSAPEYQVLDDRRHPDAANGPDRHAGALYGLYPPSRDDAAKPAGQWNRSRIVVRGDAVEHWLNDTRVAAFRIGSPDWNARLARSKFKDWPEFAAARRGAIGLQDHGDEVAYRNIRIRALP
ncbi:DUF1080 domain-containing protein [Lysobacter sp. BMK333-48F3]|uniref:3-keto-disaccharide hydrolase n=1 Tax=Lysobacter sp. BMK333-48F3 TaxID=2867962 RepID=UPI001C8C5917|nr:DUF1080 domain-containing protein [Lysobacter sp. BMK333-48F3]